MSYMSTKLTSLGESNMAGGGANHTVGHTGSSFLSNIFGLAHDGYPVKAIPGQVDEKDEKNDKREVHLPPIHNLEHDRKISDQSITDGQSSLHLHQQDYQVHPAVLPSTGDRKSPPLRILHIVTALAEYNSGLRGTITGQDRLQEVMIPVLVDSVSTMISPPYQYQVDVYLVLGWKLKAERRRLIEDALPEGVGLEIWDDATPLGYDANEDITMKEVTRGLARQHRFVIKDKFEYYDFFSVFEDDMRVTGGHISHFLELTAELKRLHDEAPDSLPDEPQGSENKPQNYEKEHFHGPLSKVQLSRMMPGFIRAEVLLHNSEKNSQTDLGPIPVDLEFSVKDKDGTITTQKRTFDPVPCCHVDGIAGLPQHPSHDQVMIWEAGVLGANVRKFPPSSTSSKPDMLDWILLQPGAMKPYFQNNKFVGGYWSGRNNTFGLNKGKPDGYEPRYFGNQGGWMATKEQLTRIHHEECVPGFFPPFDPPAFKEDGLIYQSVEFWSGGIQLFSGRKSGCNMQRVISLHPDHFSKHFIYHTANNKQKRENIPVQRVVKVNNFYGQLNSIVKSAKRAMSVEEENR